MTSLTEALMKATEACQCPDCRAARAKPAPLPEAVADDLKNRRRAFEAPRDFKPGDLVTQVACLVAYNFPDPGVPSIVMDRYERRVDDPGSSGAVRESDMIIGVMAPGGEFARFAVDSRRFEPWVPKPEGSC